MGRPSLLLQQIQLIKILIGFQLEFQLQYWPKGGKRPPPFSLATWGSGGRRFKSDHPDQ